MFPLAAGCKFYANCDGKKEYYIKWMAIFSFQIIDILKRLSIAQLVYFPNSVPIITNNAVRSISQGLFDILRMSAPQAAPSVSKRPRRK